MSKAEILEHIRQLPEPERREIVQAIEEEFGIWTDELTPEQVAELDRRADDALKNPGRGTPVEEVSAEIQKRIRAGK